MLTLRLACSAAGEIIRLTVDDDNRVVLVELDSIAHRAGLIVGDIVTKVDAHDLEGTPLPNLQADVDAGRSLMLTVRRGIRLDNGVTFTPRRNSADL